MLEKDKNKIFLILFILIIVIIALIITLNLSFFNGFINKNIEKYGYPAVSVLTFAIDLFESPINTDLPAIFATILGLNVLLVFIFATIGDFFGLLISFYIGKKYLSTKVQHSCSTKREYQKYCKFFYKYGKLALLVAMVTPLPNILFVWLAGSFHIKLKDFIIFGYLPSMLRMGLIILLTQAIF